MKVTHSRVRRKRMGHINLAAPVVHIWYLRGTRSWLAYLLAGIEPKEELKAKQLEKVIYFAAHLVSWVDEEGRHEALPNLEAEYLEERDEVRSELELAIDRRYQELEAAAEEVLARPERLAMRLGLPGAAEAWGALIGAELAATRAYWLGQPLALLAGSELYLGGTFAWHPAACAGALKGIEVMERDGVLKHVARLERLVDRVRAKIEIDPHNSEPYRWGGKSYALLGRYEEAVDERNPLPANCEREREGER